MFFQIISLHNFENVPQNSKNKSKNNRNLFSFLCTELFSHNRTINHDSFTVTETIFHSILHFIFFMIPFHCSTFYFFISICFPLSITHHTFFFFCSPVLLSFNVPNAMKIECNNNDPTKHSPTHKARVSI